ncbi:WD40 repeat-like protein [Paxillus ammoniavirescens]|nr:WD40 repeat-like protein [Paxillus ammoniavirescens]
MSTSSRSVSSESANVPSLVASPSSQPMSSDKASDQVPVQVFEGHENRVNCVRFYPDESKLVSGSRDGTLRIWDRKTGAVEVLKGHTNAVWDVDVSRDGKMVISGGSDETVRIWNGETGETMHVFKGHERLVRSVGFSRDSTRVVSGSNDWTMRVWSVETGELAFEPIECHGIVFCARYSPSGDRVASGAERIQIWSAETGSKILSIRNSEVTSLVWTADGLHVIGEHEGNITIWNSQSGERLRTWKTHENIDFISILSLSLTGTYLATSNLGEKLAFVWDISTGEQVAAFKHSQNSKGIAYSPSGQFIATGCEDNKVYVWEAPAFEDPRTKSRPPSFSWFLDQPAIPLAGPSRNVEINPFWDSQPNISIAQRDQQASPSPRRIFNKVKSTFTNLFAHRSAGATQTSPVRETIQPVEVAAGRPKKFWIVIERTVWTPLNTFIFMVFYCRKPGPAERRGFAPINRGTNANSSQAATGNAAKTKQPEHPETVHGTGNVGTGPHSSPTQAGNSVIRTQPERIAAMSLSGAENRISGPDSSLTLPETIEMVARSRSSITSATQHNSTVPTHASLGPQPTPSTDPLSPAVTPYEASSSTSPVTPAPLSVSSNVVPPTSAQSSSPAADLPVSVAVPVSPEELAMLQEFRRHKAVTEHLSGPAHDHDPFTYPYASATLSERRVGLDPLLKVVPSLRSPSLSPSRHFLTPTITSNVQSMHTMASAHDPLTKAPLESVAQLGMRRPANDEDVDLSTMDMTAYLIAPFHALNRYVAVLVLLSLTVYTRISEFTSFFFVVRSDHDLFVPDPRFVKARGTKTHEMQQFQGVKTRAST